MSKPCFVYLVDSDAPIWPERKTRDVCSVFKVGISQNPRARLEFLRTSSPFQLSLYSTWKLPDREMAQTIEREFHDEMSKCRLSGEWFYDDVVGCRQSIDYIICRYIVDKRRMSPRDAVAFLDGVFDRGDGYALDVVVAEYGADAI